MLIQDLRKRYIVILYKSPLGNLYSLVRLKITILSFGKSR